MNNVFWKPGTGLAIILRPRGADWLENDRETIQISAVQTIISAFGSCEARELNPLEEDPTTQKPRGPMLDPGEAD